MPYKLMKNGHEWDYSTHLVDVETWEAKVLLEEPDSVTEILPCSLEEMRVWKEY